MWFPNFKLLILIADSNSGFLVEQKYHSFWSMTNGSGSSIIFFLFFPPKTINPQVSTCIENTKTTQVVDMQETHKNDTIQCEIIENINKNSEENEIYERITAQKEQYPNGMTWTNDNLDIFRETLRKILAGKELMYQIK